MYHPRPVSSLAQPAERHTVLHLGLATAFFAAIWLWQVVASNGFLEADATTHYLIARFALDETFSFVDVWGRPVKTAVYAIPAYFGGRLGVQSVSLCLAVLSAWFAYLLARDLGFKRPELAFLFTLAQPLVFLHSFSELTELPFAALLVIAFYCYTKKWWLTAALLVGFLPLARPEGFGFFALAAGGFLLQRRWGSLLLLPLGLIAWSYLGWEAYGRDGPYQSNPSLLTALDSIRTWLPRHWPYAGDSVYTENRSSLDALWRLIKFPATLPAVVGPAVFPALLAGFVVIGWKALSVSSARDGSTSAAGQTPTDWIQRGKQVLTHHESRVALLAIAIPMMILVGHSVLYFLGKMATNGELRYMLVVAPFWAILTAAGWEWIATFLRRDDGRTLITSGEAFRVAAYAVLVPLAVNARLYTVLPIRFDSDWETTRFVAHWADAYGKATGRPALMSAHPGVFYFLDRSRNDPILSRDFVSKNLQNPPPGTLLLYDPMYARYNASRDRRIDGTDELRAAGWIEHPTMTIGRWRIFLSPQPQMSP